MSVVYVTPHSNLNRKTAFLFVFVWFSIQSVLLQERFSFSLFVCKRRANCNVCKSVKCHQYLVNRVRQWGGHPVRTNASEKQVDEDI
jgi:hypothetical protein